VSPINDAGITYSFDASRGPRRGSQILEMALAKAVEQYEGREFERLVREEYEVVSEEGTGSETERVVEEGFELV
jgi:hypothetical protein